MNNHSIRNIFANKWLDKEFVIDKSGSKMLEIVGASFIPTEEFIFGQVNRDYVEREIQWYHSQSLNVNDIPGKVPEIWKQVADSEGVINSNYGWCIFSKDNGNQYKKALDELIASPLSRRAIMIYTRPEMWVDYNYDGRSDFMCTNAVQYVIRNNALSAIVQMRSNDVVFGFRNDYAWQKHVLEMLLKDLNDLGMPYVMGNIVWQVGSLHVYERHFDLVDHYARTGTTTGPKK